jgi:hypothetical protein
MESDEIRGDGEELSESYINESIPKTVLDLIMNHLKLNDNKGRI